MAGLSAVRRPRAPRRECRKYPGSAAARAARVRPSVWDMAEALELDGRRPHRPRVQPGQGLLPAARLHQGRPGPLLPERRRRHPARAARPAHHPGALPRRRGGRVVLPEAGPEEPARLDSHRPHLLPQRPPRRRDLPDRDRRRRLGGEPRLPDLPPLAGAPRRHRAPGRTAHRPRPPAGHRLRGRGARRPGAARGARRPRPDRLAQDLRRARPARLRADRPRVDLRPGAALGDRGGPRAGAARARADHHRLVEGGARREDLRGLQPDRPRPHHRQRLFGTARARTPRSPRRCAGTS